MSDTKLKVGKRYLLRRLWSRINEEHTVKEIAASGRYFKSGDNWVDLDDYHVVEELPPLPKEAGQ